MERSREERFSDFPDDHPNFDLDSHNRVACFLGAKIPTNTTTNPNTTGTTTVTTTTITTAFRITSIIRNLTSLLAMANLILDENEGVLNHPRIRPLFEQHGNVIEVIFIKDKRTGKQQGSCFVKFAMLEEAESAIRALHNQLTLPGETNSNVGVHYHPFPLDPLYPKKV
ncbi:RNA recognition motif domain [Dillenia turbinata]|uniref:RNA recognition motif domain n=1 Tax=Dillenia turbinata TaxID=194707 RepID=A0AAN8ZKQ2_9MAGN